MTASRCQTCATRIVWALTSRGRRMPVDADPHPAGNILLTDHDDGTVSAVVVGKLEDAHGAPLHRSHFTTCPQADAWRKR